MNLKRTMMKRLYPLLVVPIAAALVGCSMQSQDSHDEQAKQIISSVRQQFDAANNSDPDLSAIDLAYAQMQPLLDHPEHINPKFDKQFSFDGSQSIQTTLGIDSYLTTMYQIIGAYESVGNWQRAHQAVLRTADFLKKWESVHAHGADSQQSDFFLIARENARCLEKLGDKEKSREISANALKMLTDYPGRISCGPCQYRALAIISAERGDAAEEVDRLFEMALKQEGAKPSWETLQLYAQAAMQAKQYAKAEELLRKVRELQSADKNVYNPDIPLNSATILARCLWMEGKHSDAVNVLRKAFEARSSTAGLSDIYGRSGLALAYFVQNSATKPAEKKSIQIASDRCNYLSRLVNGKSAEGGHWAQRFAKESSGLQHDLKLLDAGGKVSLADLQSQTDDWPLFNFPLPGDVVLLSK